MSTTRILLDCDPGVDDALAILLAHAHPDIELVGITTVAGNHTLETVTRNAQQLLAFLDAEHIPVAAGADRPLLASPVHATHIHGQTGLGSVTLPAPTVPRDPRHAAQLLIDTVMAAAPRSLTLVATGALTNLALALRLQPALAHRVDRVVLMGGSATHGNITPYAEFNIYCDPEAAAIVFGAEWDLTMVGLHLTHQALATPEVCQRLRCLGTRSATVATELLDFYGRAYANSHALPAPPVHDLCAIAAVIDPEVMTTFRRPVEISLSGPTRGATLVDHRTSAAGTGITVADTLAVTRLWDLVVGAYALLP